MAAGYYEPARSPSAATFELFVRRLPHNRNFILAAGLTQAVEYLQNLRYTAEEIAYLRACRSSRTRLRDFFDMLASCASTGDLFAVPEGTPLFAATRSYAARAVGEAQIPETYLLATIGFQSMIATKAARVVEARRTIAWSSSAPRRAPHSGGGNFCGRASYIGGCAGTSNTEAGLRFGVPVFGTAAHSWVMSFSVNGERSSIAEALGTRRFT